MNDMELKKSFFLQPTEKVAKLLLGCILINETKEGITSGKIVETEAYLQNDPACHAFNGKTKRNEPMFREGGIAYVYFTYGMHYCFNVVTQREGIGEAVLIRALEPLEGVELMKKRRGINETYQLCNGPAKLVQAMGITKEHNGVDLIKGNLKIILPNFKEKKEIVSAKRIGIKKGSELLLRFYLKGSKFVSKK